MHNYDLGSGVSAKALNAQTHRLRGPGFGILGNADIAKNMGMTGGRPDIGPVTLANSIWLMTQHRDAARYALAQADAAGSIPWHYFDSETGAYLTVTRHPKLWADYRGGKWDTKGLTQPGVEEHGWSPDGAHQPDLSYVPYILTGLRYRLDQLHAQAAGTLIGHWPASRQDDKAIVTSRIEQVRGRAWVLRGVNESSFVCPDGSVLCPYFHASVANSVQYLRQEAVQMTKGETFGWFRYDQTYPPGAGQTAPWQQDFLANTLTLLALQGVPGAKEVLLWQTNFLAGRFLAESRGFHPNSATAYQLVMFRDTADDPFLTWREVYERSLAGGYVKDGSAWSNDDWAYVKMAKAALAGIVSATGSPAALQALDWMNLNAPHVGLDDQRDAPGSNIVPLVPGGR